MTSETDVVDFLYKSHQVYMKTLTNVLDSSNLQLNEPSLHIENNKRKAKEKGHRVKKSSSGRMLIEGFVE
jgi:hypothetical protein